MACISEIIKRCYQCGETEESLTTCECGGRFCEKHIERHDCPLQMDNVGENDA